MLPIGIGGNTLSGYYLQSSLRFRRSASGYLERTPSSSGTSSTQATWSMWVKLAQVQNNELGVLFEQGNTSNDRIFINVRGNGSTYPGSIQFGYGISASYRQIITNDNATLDGPKFVDPSAWYHLVCVLDTPNATQNDRMRIYVNGERQTITYSTLNLCVQSESTVVSSTNVMRIGSNSYSLSNNFDGYLTEYNFVDGQALTPSDFGETDTITGVWKPKEYTGTYGTNGFYLPMKETQQATGFNTVLYTGTSSTQSIANVGFSPDFIWIKRRSGANAHQLYDTVRGAGYVLKSDSTNAEAVETAFNSFDADGFEIDGGSGSHNLSGESYVAWCWDAGSSTVSNTDGSITSSVRANPASGFSIVTYTGNGSSGTVGHGLGSAPEMIIIKNRNQADGWYVWHQNNGAGIYGYLFLNSTDQVRSSTPQFGTTAPDSSVISLTYNTNDWANASGENYVAYCFSEVAGFSKFGSYTGNGSTSGPTVTTGFRPAFVMLKIYDGTGSASDQWVMLDNTRSASNTTDHRLFADSSQAESTGGPVDFLDDGFQLKNSFGNMNASGKNYIYMAFADTRDFQWNFDASGNKNNWTPNNINSNASSETTYDLMSDVPIAVDEDTANYPTINPVDASMTAGTITNANLTRNSNGANSNIFTTMGATTGKYYYELDITGTATTSTAFIGWAQKPYTSATGRFYNWGTAEYFNGSAWSSYGATCTSGDTVGIAIDIDGDTIEFYKNGVSQGQKTSVGWDTTNHLAPTGYTSNSQTADINLNFGQRPFKYTPPTGYKKLNTFNLPDSSITDGSNYMNSVLWTGTGTTTSFTSMGFSPDLVWLKRRDTTSSNFLVDSVRGASQALYANDTTAEVTRASAVTSFDSDGWSMGSDFNSSGGSYVTWGWRGSDSTAVTNTDGTITSTVSANPTSGFSVVTWTATSSSQTVGHGLGVAPEIIIMKNRSTTSNWGVFHTVTGSHKLSYLNLTNAQVTPSESAPTSSIFNVAQSSATTGTSGHNMVAYCFHSVEGFSKFGSYTGNGSADGPFIYTGFRPAFILEKNANSAYGWLLWDTSRSAYNMVTKYLVANSSGAEVDTLGASGPNIDILSNGFKVRDPNPGWNQNGSTHVYMAFAEVPFKNSLGR